MNLDDWPLQAASQEEVLEDTQRTLSQTRSLGFRCTSPKSLVEPTQNITWLGMVWDTPSATLRPSKDNRTKVLQKLRRTLWTRTCNHRVWASLMGSLSFAAQAVPLGRLWCRRPWWEGNRCFPSPRPFLHRPIPLHVRALPSWRVRPGVLSSSVPWRHPAPQLDTFTYASDTGRGYQASTGLQGRGKRSQWNIRKPVNERELHVP